MERQITNVTFSLSGPATLLAFTVVFFVLYLRHRQHTELLVLSITGAMFSLGMLKQIIDALSEMDTGLSANLLYLVAAFCFCIALAMRSGRKPAYFVLIPVFAAIAVQTWYFTSVAPNQIARIYLINFAVGLILVITAIAQAPKRHGHFTEKLVFWTLFLFGFHFFPRTLLTTGIGMHMEQDVFLLSPYWFVLQLSLAALGASVAIALLCASVYELAMSSAEDTERDRLTRLYTRRAFHQRAEDILAQTSGQPATLAILDINHFGQINAARGYEEGDRVLTDFATLLSRSIRRTSLTGRFGGEEFLILLPKTKLTVGVDCLKELMGIIRSHNFSTLTDPLTLTVGCGVVEISDGETFPEALMRAQSALELATAKGDDQVIALPRNYTKPHDIKGHNEVPNI